MAFGEDYTHELSYTEIEKLIDNQEMRNKFSNITDENTVRTYLMVELLKLIADDSPYVGITAGDRQKLLLALMAHYDLVWDKHAIDNVNMDRLIKWSRDTIYYVDAFKGNRVATEKEVENGVVGLKPKTVWLFGDADGEEIYKQLNIMQWSINGRLRYYKEAGFEYTWKDNGPVETFFELFLNSSKTMSGLYSTLRTEGKFESIVKSVNKAVRHGRIKHPTFAVDEIGVSISPKMLIFECNKQLWNYDGFVDSKRIISRISKDSNFKPAPEDIAQLRRDYQTIISVEFTSKNEGKKEKEARLTEEQTIIKNKCDTLDNMVTAGLLQENEFALKITSTIKKYGYSKCSEKQMKILDDAIEKAKKSPNYKASDWETGENTGESTERRGIITEQEMPDLADSIFDVIGALGRGEFM